MFFALAPGEDADEVLERLGEDEPPRDPQLEAELARVLTGADPTLEPVRDEQGVVQLDGPDMQACLEPGHLVVNVAYWSSVDVAALLRRLEAIADALGAWRGRVAFDPQLGRLLDLPRDAPEVQRKVRDGRRDGAGDRGRREPRGGLPADAAASAGPPAPVAAVAPARVT